MRSSAAEAGRSLAVVGLVGLLVAAPAGAAGPVTLEWYGHAFVRLTLPGGVRVALDPFGAIGYPMPKVEADIVTVSHEHGDHNNARLVGGEPTVLRGLDAGGDWRTIDHRRGDVRVTGIPVHHDAEAGRRRGKNTMVVVDLAGVRVAHLSDMGHEPTEAQYRALGRIDVLLVPVGGHFSIDGRTARQIVDRLRPKVAIPIHYRTAATADWPIEDEQAFVAGFPRVKRVPGNRVTLDPSAWPAATEIWVLTPPRDR